MKTIELNAVTRSGSGKGPARRCRMEGHIPGILYGVGIEPESLSVSFRDFTNAARREETVRLMVDLKFDGNGRTQRALVRDIQYDPISGRIIHLDFQHVSADRKIKLTVPVHIKGIAEGVKTHGGILQHIMRELEIESLPGNIPEFVEVDVTELGIGDTIHVRDLNLEGITLLSDVRRTMVSVVPPTVIKETVTTADADAEAAGEPEVVGEGEEGEEKAAEGDAAAEKKDDKKKDEKKK